MKRVLLSCLVLTCTVAVANGAFAADAIAPLRPPAVPLVTHDPYFSIWSFADRLTDDTTRHWTKAPHSLTSLVRIDGRTYRLMGAQPKDVPAMPQIGVNVLPTRTICDFETPQAHIALTFLTPALPDDLDVLSRPVTYLTWEARSLDGQPHAISVYFSASAELAVNAPDQNVSWSREEMGALTALRIGSADQSILQKKGDDLRIDWGYAYVAAKQDDTAAAAIAADGVCAKAFVDRGQLPAGDDERTPRAVKDELPVMAMVLDLGTVAKTPVSRYLMLAYDDVYSINYFGRKLRPYWRRNGDEAGDLLLRASRDYAALQKRCQAFDDELMADLTRVGGEKYARLAALSYRECLAGNKLAADAAGQPLLFPKENTSNGCIGTVDVIYPMDPFFILFSPTLAKASVVTVLSYSASERWKFPFAPHDLGTYPLATAQAYGGGERTEEDQMPVEESGDMILILAAIAKEAGNADFPSAYWPQVTQWAEYLADKGFDPENQLCTDDFAGHLAHNANLSIKAIEALGAYALLCEMRGDKDGATKYRKLIADLPAQWMKASEEGDHYRLAFDQPGSWSQKYNLVWDRILDLNLFPPDVAAKEMAFYRKHLNRYGLPLDSRKEYAKLDWSLWTATLSNKRDDFDALVSPLYDFANATPDRVPLSDFYWTKDGRDSGMHARPVVGGVFIKMLADRAMWKKWSGRDKAAVSHWAPLPAQPDVKEVVPASRRESATWRYTIDKPADGWFQPDFKAADWKEGPAGFGTSGTPGATVRTEWKTGDIWIRRGFTMPEGKFSNLQFLVHHDEDVEIYIDGVLAAKSPGYTSDYEPLEMSSPALAALTPGKHTLAAHCHQTTGGQYIDIGIVEITERK